LFRKLILSLSYVALGKTTVIESQPTNQP